jgi:hypothetical protein
MLEDNGYGKLGFYSNAMIYLALGIGSLISTGVMNKIGEIRTMALGGYLCVTFMGSFILTSLKADYTGWNSWLFSPVLVYTTLIITSFVNGIGEAIMWVAQGKYISDCATVNNKGFFFGYFWAYYMSSQIFGNFIAAVVLGKISQTAYVVIMTVLTLAAAILF